MNYGVTYRAPSGGRLAGLLCGWCHSYGIPALYQTYDEAAALLDRYPFLRDLEGRVATKRVVLPYVTANVEVFSGYRHIVTVDGRPRQVVCNTSRKSYAQLLPLLTRLSQAVCFQKEVGSFGSKFVGSRIVRLKTNRTLRS